MLTRALSKPKKRKLSSAVEEEEEEEEEEGAAGESTRRLQEEIRVRRRPQLPPWMVPTRVVYRYGKNRMNRFFDSV